MTKSKISRREFVQRSAGGILTLTALGAGYERAFASGSDKIRIGVIGCGGRGTGAVLDCIHSSEGVEIVALGDLFQDKVARTLKILQGKSVNLPEHLKLSADKVKVTKDRCFLGFDAYKKVLACDLDLVILATPPQFRPEHIRAAIEAGKHVFAEKPVAVDPVGVRVVLAASEQAEKKGLALMAGTQRRHQRHYIEIMKRVHNGDIGEIIGGQCYWNGEAYHARERKPQWSDMEWQIRNWHNFVWLCGDQIVEQHIHNIDVLNWAIGTHPVKALSIGGQEVYDSGGDIFDHFTTEYEYPNGVRVMSMCRSINGCSIRISERIVGSRGTAYTDTASGFIKGAEEFKVDGAFSRCRYDGPNPNPYMAEHADLIASIRAGKPLNEGVRVAESTLTAILGRMSAYTGRELKWDWVMKKSQLDLRPKKYELGDLPISPAAVPGKTPLI